MGRSFAVQADNLTLGTGSVLVVLQTAASPNAGAILRLCRVEVTQSASTVSAPVRLLFSTRDTTGTLTTTSVTPVNLALGGAASGLAGNTSVIGGAGRIGINSSADSGGAYTNHHAVAPNQLNGWLWQPTPEERLLIPPSTVWCARFAAAPTSNTGWDVTLVYEELI